MNNYFSIPIVLYHKEQKIAKMSFNCYTAEKFFLFAGGALCGDMF